MIKFKQRKFINCVQNVAIKLPTHIYKKSTFIKSKTINLLLDNEIYCADYVVRYLVW